MTVAAIVTYIFAAAAAVSATAILFVKQVFHAALLLLICLICIAGIFVTLNAEFLAVVQLIVYAGGVVLLIVFGIMLTRKEDLPNTSDNKLITAIIGTALLSVMVYALGDWPASDSSTFISPERMGALLMTKFAVPFEIAGFLLLISLVGAIVAAVQGKRN